MMKRNASGAFFRTLAIAAAIALVWFGFSYRDSGPQDPIGDPLVDIRNAREIDSVWIAGNRLESSRLASSR